MFFAYLASEQFTRAALPIDLGQNAVDFFADAYLQGLFGPGQARGSQARGRQARGSEACQEVALTKGDH